MMQQPIIGTALFQSSKLTFFYYTDTGRLDCLGQRRHDGLSLPSRHHRSTEQDRSTDAGFLQGPILWKLFSAKLMVQNMTNS